MRRDPPLVLGWAALSDDAANELVCTGCGLAYPVRDNIPVLLVDEARQPGAAGAQGAGSTG